MLSNDLARLSVTCFIQKTFAIKSRSRQKTEETQTFWRPIFWEGQPRLFYFRLLVRFIIRRLKKFGRVPFADVGLRSLAMK